ncbi:hypothetical protein U14_02981 [Candidatus Moduliflexus flocculans]|uniref:CULT domain-containing protein n=1 Tax=Candidatus Moduliflexus flocculans TaxID=1499966 RepID=A0A081BMX0_9BACT|nr:hypothetical protein U14_02981 [Candidatus Moduliflexus flocculans]
MFPLFIVAKGSTLVRPTDETDAADLDTPEKADALLCSTCRAPIASLHDRISVNERHEHVFANPHGYIYQIGCFAAAPGCALIGEETAFFSWFPGYAWQIALCRQCAAMLGWGFRSQDSRFFGLILENLIASQQ